MASITRGSWITNRWLIFGVRAEGGDPAWRGAWGRGVIGDAIWTGESVRGRPQREFLLETAPHGPAHERRHDTGQGQGGLHVAAAQELVRQSILALGPAKAPDHLGAAGIGVSKSEGGETLRKELLPLVALALPPGIGSL